MSDYVNYDEAIQTILSSDTAVNDKYKAAGNASPTLCDINQTVNQIQDMTVVRNRGGEVIGYDYRYTTPRLPNTSIMEVDSNTDNGWYATGGGGSTSGNGTGRSSNYAGQIDGDEGSTDKMKSGGLISGLISAGWAGVSALSKFGKNVGSAAADAIETLGTGLGVAFNDLMVDSSKAAGDAVRALFGVDNQGNTTMYLDEDTLGAIAIQAKEDGFFDKGGNSYVDGADFITPYTLRYQWNYPIYFTTDLLITENSGYWKRFTVESGNYVIVLGGNHYSGGIQYWVYLIKSPSETSGTIRTETSSGNIETITVSSNLMRQSGSLSGNYSFNIIPYERASEMNAYVMYELSNLIFNNYSIVNPQAIPGVDDQEGATIPVDAITGADPHVVAENLASQYPQVMGSPVQIVVMDDSCNQVTKKYYSVPISYSPTNLNINAPITGGFQVSPSFNPNVSLDLPDINLDNYVDQVIKILGGSGAGRDVTIEPEPEDPETQSKDISGGTLPVEVPKTGEGDTPAVVPPTVDVTSMWHIYNPSPESLYALGAWLWSANIWEQIVRMFSNPMEAIMGVHAIYALPEISSQVPIVVGNLTSTANANKVTAQYKSIDCGEVWFTEYFGNVFDYEPFTTVQLYLPFIGIVPLSVADCMRAKIGVAYTIDFYTGACVAKVSVTRDGAGGVIYEYPGNCATEYPVSSSSYSRMIQSIVASAMSAVSVGMHTRGAPGTAALGAATAAGTFIASGEKFQVQHSGSFSGNHGAMGSKIPYLIISRPQTNMAINFEKYDGYRSNYTTQLSSCSGYTKCKEVHLNCPGAYKQELDEIESLLLSGVIFSQSN